MAADACSKKCAALQIHPNDKKPCFDLCKKLAACSQKCAALKPGDERNRCVAACVNPPASTQECISINAYIRNIDTILAWQVTESIPCNDFRAVLKKLSATYGKSAIAKRYLDMIADIFNNDISCRGDVVVNVAQLRRKLARFGCLDRPNGGGVAVTLAQEQINAPPMPRGYVIPRLWDPQWTPAWAKSKGWIRDPYYDWLMPVSQVPSKGTEATVSKPSSTVSSKPSSTVSSKPSSTVSSKPSSTVSSKPSSTVSSKPNPKPTVSSKPVQDDTPTDDDDDLPTDDNIPTDDLPTADDEKKSDATASIMSTSTWIWIVCICLCIVCLGIAAWYWWTRYRTAGQFASSAGDWASGGGGSEGYDYSAPDATGGNVPSTTDLMSDLRKLNQK